MLLFVVNKYYIWKNLIMKSILNIYKLEKNLDAEKILKLELNAMNNKSLYNIIYKVQAVNENNIYIQATQGKNINGLTYDNQSLIENTMHLFQPFFPSKIINVYPSPFSIPVVDVVTPEWINTHLHKYGIKIKNLSDDTGIPASNFSAWINGLRPMSQIVKAMIFNVMKIYSLKELVIFLNTDSPYPQFFFIKKYFDVDLIRTLIVSNKNNNTHTITLKETINDFQINVIPI